MKTINDCLSELVEGSIHIISNPKTIEDLQQRGVKITQIKTPKTEG